MDAPLLSTKPPLIISSVYPSSLYNSIIPLLKLVDETTGKELTLLDLILHAARRTDLDDVYVCINRQTHEVKDYIQFLQEKKRKRLGKLKIEVLELSDTTTEADLFRRLEEQWSSVLSRGFLMIPAHVMPPDDMTVILDTHRQMAKKDSAIVATFYPVQVSPTSSMSVPNERSIMITDSKTSELMAYLRFDGYKTTDLDFKALIPLEGRWEVPPESVSVRSDLRLDGLFFGTSELLNLMRQNFDYKTLFDLIDNSLRGEIKMESIYLVTKHLQTFSKSQHASQNVPAGAAIAHGRQLYEILRHDALKDNDKINTKGTRSSWKFDTSNKVVRFESVIVDASTASESLFMEGVQTEAGVKVKNSIIGRNVMLRAGCSLESVCVLPDVPEIPQGTEWRNGVIMLDTMVSHHEALMSNQFYKAKDVAPGISSFHKPVNVDHFLWNETPNSAWKEHLMTLENDPSRDPDKIFDALYGSDNEDSSDSENGGDRGVGGEDFEKEAASMLESVLSSPDYVRNIILELRTYRLSANKSDLAVLKAVMPVIANWLQQNINTQNRDLSKMEDSALGELMEAFSSADDPRAQPIILDCCASVILGHEISEARMTNFINALYVLQPFTKQEEALEDWIRHQDPKLQNALSRSQAFRRYKDWLLADESVSGEESE
eukprot:Blabericola_migrator_1__5942@NODE_2_length_32877_cov_165_790003_g1_i0_p6_GENE_NODE_2_length_32877_cov_165_790003_g1_i0NODE_2_length_32877_cov_165_790003_g1_i0_p6_ORF_typecomplete_len661_score117_88NTP_transferase/PF00483_23/0_00012DUF4954/PF16314_5/0_004UPF0158/PF03682_13/7_3e03UPF0158/PF03682_13/5_7e03UPF0158/PF03682_13/0_31DUF2281/PF10047_9/0_31DUF713/PF05218_14/1_5e03DUF713/PF05218_14/8_7e02DUF713/PF05218_14/0_46_NODE_2_length_32877_cov_165_790003_g1_i0863310615